MISLENKTALVTGASRGLGFLIAEYLASHGCHLLVHSRKKQHSEAACEKLSQFPVRLLPVAADLAVPDEVSSMLNTLDTLASPVDIVFNNAGIQVAYREDVWQTPASDFNQSFQVNCIAPAMICYHLLPKMLDNGFGRVVNVTSGIANEPQQAGYSASKAALDKFSIDLAAKLCGDVLLNLCDPGWCSTDLGGSMAPNKPESSLPGLLLGAFIDDGLSGRIFRAQEFAGMSLAEALARAESGFGC